MSGHPFAYSSAPVRRVEAVQFGILSPEEIVCFGLKTDDFAHIAYLIDNDL